MIIYSQKPSSRLHYTLNVIFRDILKIPFQVVDTLSNFTPGQEIVINYSNKEIADTLQLYPAGLIDENGIEFQDIKSDFFEEIPILFHTGKGDIPFDVFSAVFYMVSRYEEYLPYEGDIHGRFKAENSTAFKNGFHKLPIVELWCKMLAGKLNILFPVDNYHHQLTIDIDNAWKHRNKGFFRTIGSFIKLIGTGNKKELIEKVQVLRGKIEDTADTFNYLESIQNKLIKPIQYFVLTGTKGKFDRAISAKNKNYRQLLQKLYSRNKIGLHPSYLSVDSIKDLEKEYYALCAVFINKIVRSRQHYLRMKFPDTFRNLIRLGIREEYSMGWSSQLGFRAGVSRPFPFYDLLAEKETHLILIPFAAMDRTLKDYLKNTPEEAIHELKKLCDTTRSVGGVFVMLWHNDSVNDAGEWKGWRTVFEQVIEYAETTSK